MRALISILVDDDDDDDDDDPGYCDIHLMAAVAPQMLQLTSVLELARAALVDKVHPKSPIQKLRRRPLHLRRMEDYDDDDEEEEDDDDDVF